MRNGRAAAAPLANTVSMCAISSTLPLPVPLKVATMLSPAAGAEETVSTAAPSFFNSSVAMAPTAFIPSASPVPESMLTSRSQSLIAPGLCFSALSRIGLTASAATAGATETSATKCQRGKPAKHHRPPAARSGNAAFKPSRDAFSTPRSVISPVTSRAGVTSKA